MTQAVDLKAPGQATCVRYDGGAPTEAFAASLAGFVAFHAGRFLTRHGLSREGLTVAVTNHMAADGRARVAEIHLTVRVPEAMPALRRPASPTVVESCTVHNSLTAHRRFASTRQVSGNSGTQYFHRGRRPCQ